MQPPGLAFESEGRLVVSGWRIAMHYVCTWFVLDVVASVPYLWIFDPDSMLGLLAMLRVVRFARLERAELVWRSLFELSERHGSQLRLSKLLIYVLTIGHIAACAWYYLARWEAAYNSWTVLTGEIDGTVASRYVASLCTLGSGCVSLCLCLCLSPWCTLGVSLSGCGLQTGRS